MSDGLPTEEQLRRIARGVDARIDRRARIARGIAGTAVAVALVGGVLGLVLPNLGVTASTGALPAAGSAGGSSAAEGAIRVECHATSGADSAAVLRTAAGPDPQRLAAACDGAAFSSASGTATSGRFASQSPTPQPTGFPAPHTVVLCRADDGVLHAYPVDDRPASLCVRNGMRPSP